MAAHTCNGEYLALIAHSAGFRSPNTIWSDPGNQRLRESTRRTPNMLRRGDSIVIPDLKYEKEESAQPGGAQNTYHVETCQVRLRVRLQDPDGNPMHSTAYTLTFDAPDGLRVPAPAPQPIRKKTGADGLIDLPVPPGCKGGKLILDDYGIGWDLYLGGLEPARDDMDGDQAVISGVQERLSNLGYLVGNLGEMTPETQNAIRAFQKERMEQDDPSGSLDDVTIQKLTELAGI